MIYYFQWKDQDERILKRLKDRQGYGGFKLLEFKRGTVEKVDVSQAKVEWHGDPMARPHPLFKEMNRCGGEIYQFYEE